MVLHTDGYHEELLGVCVCVRERERERERGGGGCTGVGMPYKGMQLRGERAGVEN